jgi:hypothetical protein
MRARDANGLHPYTGNCLRDSGWPQCLAWPALVACDPQRNRDALARGRHKFLQVGRVFPTEHELAAREIEGRKEMVEERSPDDGPARRA